MTEGQVGALAPEAPAFPVPASTDAPAPDTTAVPVEKPVEAAPDSEKTFTQAELNAIVAKEKAKESRRAERYARAEAERDVYRQQLEARTAPQQQSSDEGEPDPAKFKDFDSWNKAQIAYHVKRGLQEALSSREKDSAQEHQTRADRERGENLGKKLAEAEAKHGPEIRDVLRDPDLPFNGAILAYIEDSKIGGDVAVHLANNRTEAARIAGLSPIQQVIALHALESKLTAPPTTTKAPPPITPSGTKASVEKDPEKMTDDEFAKWRRDHKRKR